MPVADCADFAVEVYRYRPAQAGDSTESDLVRQLAKLGMLRESHLPFSPPCYFVSQTLGYGVKGSRAKCWLGK
jgi:hypothetical protein